MIAEIKIRWTKKGDADLHQRQMVIEQKIPVVESGQWTDRILEIPWEGTREIDIELPGRYEDENLIPDHGISAARVKRIVEVAEIKKIEEQKAHDKNEEFVAAAHYVCAWAKQQAVRASQNFEIEECKYWKVRSLGSKHPDTWDGVQRPQSIDRVVQTVGDLLGDDAGADLLTHMTTIDARVVESLKNRMEKRTAQSVAEKKKAANREREICEWAAEHGSLRLRGQLQIGLIGWPLYLHERLAHDFVDVSGIELDNDGDDSDEINPSVAALEIAQVLAARLVDFGGCPDVATALKKTIRIRRITFEDTDEFGCSNKPDPAEYVIADSYRPGGPAFGEYRVRIRVGA